MHFAVYSLALSAVAHASDVAHGIAAVDDNRAVELPGVLKFPVKPIRSRGMVKRQTHVPLQSKDNGYSYLIELTLGTPGDKVLTIFDTGSADLWVNPQCSTSSDPQQCEQYPRFKNSSTLQDLKAGTTLSYGSGSAHVNYYADYVSVGEARIPQQVFGISDRSSGTELGVLGAGPDLNGFKGPHDYILDSLKKYKFINSRAFGVDLQGLDSDRGSVVFGGIDTKKFKGVLETRPIIPAEQSPDRYTRYWINVDDVSVTANGKAQSGTGSFAAFVDTGTTISQLPADKVQTLLKSFPEAKSQGGAYTIDCSVKNKKEFVQFKFGKTTVRVPFSDFIYEFPGNDGCILGFAEGSGTYTLGDSFLRGAYVVFDMDNLSLHIAQAVDCGTNLRSIGPGPVGAVEGECDIAEQSATSSTNTQDISTTSTESISSSSISTSTSTSSSSTSDTQSDAATTSSGTAVITSITSTDKWNITSSATPTDTSAPSDTSSSKDKPTQASITSTSSVITTYTSTFTTSKVHTITSCAPTITNCPVRLSTETIVTTTTWCPEDENQSITSNRSAEPTTTLPPTITTMDNNPPWPTTPVVFTVPPPICTNKQTCNGPKTTQTVTITPPVSGKPTANAHVPEPDTVTGTGCSDCTAEAETSTALVSICKTCDVGTTAGTIVPSTSAPACTTCSSTTAVTADAADVFRGVGTVAAVAFVLFL